MIRSWKHKGLKAFYKTGSKANIQPAHAFKLTRILQLLDAAIKPDDLNLPGMSYHTLAGDRKGYSSVSVSGNWRVIYQFEDGDAILVDYLDYHGNRKRK